MSGGARDVVAAQLPAAPFRFPFCHALSEMHLD